MRFAFIYIIGLTLLINTQLSALVGNTKHNLSVTNTAGTVKATAEVEECVFCHIPHSTRPEGKPLWNRSMPTSEYTMYNSNYLKRMGYTTPSALGTQKNHPGTLSRQCLSCHDGTIAIGSVHKLRQSFMNSDKIAMSGTEADGSMPIGATNFGTDLSNHHPVGIEYDPAITKTFGTGTRVMELKTTLAADSKIRLFEYPGVYAGRKYVECSSCHDPHVENDKFLSVDTGTNHGQNFRDTCTSCHEKVDWVGSVHQSPPAGTPLYTDPDVLARYGTGSVADLGCANCHTPHNAEEGTTYLNRKVLGQTCFQGAASTEATAPCHGVGGAKDMRTVLSRANVHPVVASSDPAEPKHTNLDAIYGTGNLDPLGIEGMNWDTNKHAVCMDCHNPHRARKGTHVEDGSWYAPPGTSTNLVSNVLRGVPGIEPTWPAAWTQPTTFSTLESAEKEYQICFKCHSYWGIGAAINGVNTGEHYSPSVPSQLLTDVAWEMNINNKSGHPVVINQKARVGSIDTDVVYGDTNLRELDAIQLLSPWKENPGLNTMYCSDCHGADNELGGDPKGPHGSNLKYILKGENQYWPIKPDGTTFYTMDDIKNNTDTGVFCKNCHDVQQPHAAWWNKMANKGYQCIQCHVAVPHGSPVSRLIGYSTFPAPYNYGGNKLTINTVVDGTTGGYRKNAYTRVNAQDVHSNHANTNGCHGVSGGSTTYDANVMP